MYLYDLTQLVKHYKYQGFKIGAVRIDLNAAYDFLDLPILGNKLKSYNIFNHEIRWIF